jgi:ethanolamine utilization protein EutQ (cupin superfamily)
VTTVGGRTSARRNPTRTILGNQVIEQQVKRICKTKATMKEGTKACTHKSRNRNKTIRLAITVYDY